VRVPAQRDTFDVLIVGSGVSGSAIAQELCRAGLRCALFEAGKHFTAATYPKEEVDASSQLYWGGGVELNHAADIGLLRPKAVGGGTIVNQALVDRFDALALDEWVAVSGAPLFSPAEMAPWYEKAEAQLSLRTLPPGSRNGNARIFEAGFRRNGYQASALRRAQKDCHNEDGNDCIECLQGCPLDSKQSTPVTTLKRALEAGLELHSECEVLEIRSDAAGTELVARSKDGTKARYRGARLVLAAGAIGNSKLLLQSGYGDRLPALGKGFYTHPQEMVLALYDEPVDAFRGAFQTMKSDDAGFRRRGFKLENVFAPPVGLAMLLPERGKKHQALMKRLRHFACIEVAVRDTAAGRIRLGDGGVTRIEKGWNAEDRRRREEGLNAISRIFRSTGARRILPGRLTIGLHLMGGCALGRDPSSSVVDDRFRLHGEKRVFAADSSIFPSAPGLNPSLTILALSLRAANGLLEEARA
jgi:choline dehydrogenase-like flavoprotein